MSEAPLVARERARTSTYPGAAEMTLEVERVAEADISAFVLNLLDDHLAAMREIRDRLRTGGRITPGWRRTIALDSVTIAERYADRLTRALNEPQSTHGPMV
jgi:hypothetical protein